MTINRRFGTTDLQVFPLCLGGNVFGWTSDEQESVAVLDAYAALPVAATWRAGGVGVNGGDGLAEGAGADDEALELRLYAEALNDAAVVMR